MVLTTYDIYLSDDQLTHEAWYSQECGEDNENLSDEEDGAEDIDCGTLSDGNTSGKRPKHLWHLCL